MLRKISWVGLCSWALIACGPPPVTDTCKGRAAGDLVVTEIMLDPAGTDDGAEWFEIYNTLGTDLDLKGMILFTRDTDGSGAKTHVIKAGTAKAQRYFTFGDIRSGALPAWIGYTYGDSLGSFGNARGVVGIKCGATVLDEATWTRVAKVNRSRMLDPTVQKTAMNNDDENKWCDTVVGAVYSGSAAGTPGAENALCMAEATLGTCVEAGVTRPIRAPVAGDLVITEVMANPKVATAANGAWFEVLANKAVDLNDVTIASPTTDTDIKSNACIPVAPGEYVLLARTDTAFINGNLPPPRVTFSLSLPTGNTILSLRRGDAGIDEAAIFASSSGVSWQLNPDKLDVLSNNDPTNFCKSPERFDGGVDAGTDYGSPGAPNKVCPFIDAGPGIDAGPMDAGDPTLCYDNGLAAFRPIVKANTGDFVITEFMADPALSSDTVGEWFEVLVSGAADLNGLHLVGNTSGTLSLTGGTCLHYDAGTLLLFANNADPAVNGNIAPLAASGTFGLSNSNGRILLYTDAGTVDQVTWTATVAAGKSKQLDVTKQDAVQNDTVANFCDSDAGIVLTDGGPGDKGTPGIANRTCP